MESKICPKCNIEQAAEYFYIKRARSDGLTRCCKVCTKKHLDSRRAKINESRRGNYANNREEILKKSLARQHRETAKEKKRVYDQEYSKKNKEKRIAASMAYMNKRLKTDPIFKLLQTLRNRLRKALKKQAKSASTIELIGCETSELKKFLESKFQPGMSWDNHGLYGWHIDHIIPCASFDLSDPEQQKKCFHYSNLQPLWAKDNLNKSDKLDYVISNTIASYTKEAFKLRGNG